MTRGRSASSSQPLRRDEEPGGGESVFVLGGVRSGRKGLRSAKVGCVSEGMMVGGPRIALPREPIGDFCRRHQIRKLALFGSVLREDFRPDSDVDVLVEFEPGHTPGLAFFAMQEELSTLLGRRVDLNTPGFLSRYFRDRVVAEAAVQYERR